MAPEDKIAQSLDCLTSVGCSAPSAALIETVVEVGVLALQPIRWRVAPIALASAGDGINSFYPSSINPICSLHVLYPDRAAIVLLAHPSHA